MTRYCVLLLFLLGLPLVFGGYPLLSLWVGKRYAAKVLFISKCWFSATWFVSSPFPTSWWWWPPENNIWPRSAPSSEACVNIVLSIWLVQRIGAVGVAVGTLGGAFVSFGMHLLVSIPRTQATILMQRSRFVLQGILRPLLGLLPSLLLYPFWKRSNMVPANPALLAIWVVLSLSVAWQIGLTREDRQGFMSALSRLLYWRRLEQT